MERQLDSQYDDDLTIGIGDYEDESIDTGFVDLFEFSGDEESPISRLKTIVLSIDWEITDEVLTQFDDELTDLQDIWADDPIKLVYVQALQKISKYIFQQKSDSHPNAIKLLLTFYYDLEKIVLDAGLSDAEKKDILRGDVKKFEQLKRQIEADGKGIDQKPAAPVPVATGSSLSDQGAPHPVLFNLKACILGMDWEITDRELSDLSLEIRRLEQEFAGHRPRELFLQGLAALGGYIKLKRSNAHADAFKLLYSFYEGLEKIVVSDLTMDEQKAILFPEVEKFESFKKVITPSLQQDESSESLQDEGLDEEDEPKTGGDDVAPAFADVPDEVHGFQAEEEASDLGDGVPVDVEDRLDDFFSKPAEPEVSEPKAADAAAAEPAVRPEDSFSREAAERVSTFFDKEATQAPQSYSPVSAEMALRGVDVETEADDDSDEDALPTQADGKLAPALADTETASGGVVEEVSAFSEDSVASQENAIEEEIGGLFNLEQESEKERAFADEQAALAGVNVESPADDDSDEEALPLIGEEELAPALFGDDDEVAGSEWQTDERVDSGEDIEQRLETLFADHDADEAPVTSAEGQALQEDAESDSETVSLTLDEEAAPLTFAEEDFVEELEADLEDDLEEDLVVVAGEVSTPAALQDDDQESPLLFDEPALAGAEEPVEQPSVDAEVEDQVAAFFEEGDSDDFLSPVAGSSDESETRREAEVLFSEADEEDARGADQLAEAIIEEDGEEVEDEFPTFGSESDEQEFFAEIDERIDQPGEFQMELLDEADDLEASAVASLSNLDDAAAARVESVAELSVEPGLSAGSKDDEDEDDIQFSFAGTDDLSDLRAGIASLGVEINEAIIGGILSAVNGLRHHYADKPVEKTFLQLISTIVQHIGQYRYEASAEAHGLLLSVFDKLELIQNPEIEIDQSQEILLAETSKVLLWQQTMLDRQAIKKGDALTFISPVRSDEQMDGVETEGNDEVEPATDMGAEDSSGAETVSTEPLDAGNDFADIFDTLDEASEPETLSLDEEEEAPAAESDNSTASFPATGTALFDDADDDDDEDAGQFEASGPVAALAGVDIDGEETETAEDEDISPDDELQSALFDTTDTDDAAGDDRHSDDEQRKTAGETSSVASYVNDELNALRNSLQSEIEDLKKRLED